jgi:dihydroorotate dehydrogenase (NAD+) catalytic subunit
MIEVTRPGKNTLSLENPIMIASGMMGFDPNSYKNLIKLEKLGAMITAPISWKPRGPSKGTRAVPLASGLLLHTGLPNVGIRKVVKEQRTAWRNSPIPIIVHLIDSNEDYLFKSARELDGLENVVGIELGIREEAAPDEIETLVQTAKEGSELPVLVKLPLFGAPWMAEIAQQAGADAVTIASPPRGTERDPHSGFLVGGRMYGPFLKPMVMRAIGQTAAFLKIPIIGCGGIHHPDDARDFLEAGAVAVQVDTLLWVAPYAVEIVARNLGGLEYTRQIGAFDDEWEPGFGKTRAMLVMPPKGDELDTLPPTPPELPLADEQTTSPSDGDEW